VLLAEFFVTTITPRCDFGCVGGKIAIVNNGSRTWVKWKSGEQIASQSEHTAMKDAPLSQSQRSQKERVAPMNFSIFSRCKCLLAALGLLMATAPFGHAGDVAKVSGSYEVLQKLNVGSQTRVRLRVRLTNDGAKEFQIQRLTLQDFSHSVRGGAQKCALTVGAKASVETTQEFTIPHADYALWQRGTRPRLLLEAQSPSGHKVTEVVRLDPVPGRKAN
jgi:hypothetical protein